MKGQSKKGSVTEIAVNIAVGTLTGMLMNYFILPLWGYTVSVSDSIGIGVVYSALSFVRSYAFRRLFNWITIRRST